MKNFQKFVKKWRKDNNVMAIVISCKHHNKNIIEIADGYTDREHKKTISSNNLFCNASITKSFISTLCLKLQEENLLNIDAYIGKYIAEYPRWKKITIRSLLNMSSGIPNFTDYPTFQQLATQSTTAFTPQKMIDSAYKNQDPFPTGTSWAYSNTGYLLIGLLLEKITRTKIGSLLQDIILTPLKLKNTFYSDTFYPENLLKKMAHGYFEEQDFYNFNASLAGAAGGIISNIHDLLTWSHSIITPGLVLSEKSIAELKQPFKTNITPDKQPPNTKYGLGLLSLTTRKLNDVYFANGIIYGYTAFMLYAPARNIAIAAQATTWPTKKDNILYINQPLVKELLNLLE